MLVIVILYPRVLLYQSHFGTFCFLPLYLCLDLVFSATMTSAKPEPLDVAGLADEWDANDTIRGRLREGKGMLHEDSGKGEDVYTCSKNNDLLLPLLQRMALHPKRMLPPIHPLQDQVSNLLSKNKRVVKGDETDQINGPSWKIRFMLGFVKMKARREEVSMEPRMH